MSETAGPAGTGAVEQVETSLAVIARLDPRLRAFAHVDADGAQAAARRVAAAGPVADGAAGVRGWPVGVKDVLDTVDQPTELGSPIYRGRRPGRDAACVARLRAAGAVVIGKTTTCEFASFHPGPTCNPHNPAHTPGGSSSGSAAAVAAGMVRAAVGTQTAGSVGRPAAFCGVVGYKPTFGWVNRSGLMPFAESLDTIGVFARCVTDAARLVAAIAARGELQPAAWPASAWPRLRVGVCHTPEWDAAEPAARGAVEAAAAALADAGCDVRACDPGAAFARAHDAQDLIAAAEGAAALTFERVAHRDRLSAALRAQLDRGAAESVTDVDAARETAARATVEVASAFDRAEVLLAPAALGEAPRGLETTGDPCCQRRWTLLGTPTVGLPAGVGPNGLPVGVQLVGPRGGDAALLAVAARLAPLLPPTPEPAAPGPPVTR